MDALYRRVRSCYMATGRRRGMHALTWASWTGVHTSCKFPCNSARTSKHRAQPARACAHSLSACLWLSTMPVEGECSAAATRSSGSSALAAAASSHTRSFTPFLWPVSSSLRSFGTWSRHQVSTCWLLDGQQQRQVALC
jgi:hypothetical protein